MGRIEYVLTVLDAIIDTKRKKHILGGVCLSASLFFGGLAFTVLTLKGEEDEQQSN